jgi:hypothetical protein
VAYWGQIEKEKMAFGGMNVQETKWTCERKIMSGIVRILMGIVLLVLVVGIWACLWVPPALGF